jgi:hypothetical protein
MQLIPLISKSSRLPINYGEDSPGHYKEMKGKVLFSAISVVQCFSGSIPATTEPPNTLIPET